jgi:hypothetical protein
MTTQETATTTIRSQVPRPRALRRIVEDSDSEEVESLDRQLLKVSRELEAAELAGKRKRAEDSDGEKVDDGEDELEDDAKEESPKKGRGGRAKRAKKSPTKDAGSKELTMSKKLGRVDGLQDGELRVVSGKVSVFDEDNLFTHRFYS